VRRATEIAVDSDYSRQRLVERFHVDPSRLHTVHLGATVIPSSGVTSDITGPYILSVGERRLHKNLETLIAAFDAVRGELPDGCKLVLVGKPYRDYRGAEDTIARLGLGDRVIILGFVPDATLAALYDGATAYAFPSFYEGFGLPLLEAMARGVPIVCSRATCLPEILGDAGLLVDPADTAGWERALVRVTTDTALRATLAEAGRRRISDFDWQRTAAETLAVYRACAARHAAAETAKR
jgi:alpha-1,3-rhamnosyl/mannosyltransferase